MHAAVQTQYGTPDVLTIQQVQNPTMGPAQVLVRVEAAAVTQGDRRLRAADFPGLSAVFGRLMFGIFRPRKKTGGTMFAGTVAAVGPNSRFAVGDRVFGSVNHGAYAERLVVDERAAVAKMPAGLSFAEAAALPYGAGTALTFLRDMAKVQRGERVLIVGASGGVGQMAVQIARHLGAHVTGATRDEGEHVRALGAHETIDGREERYWEVGETWDVIFDTTSGYHFDVARPALNTDGRYLSLDASGRLLLAMMGNKLRRGPRALTGVSLGDTAQMEELGRLAEMGALRAPIRARVPLSNIADAHRLLEEKGHGAVVVEMAPIKRAQSTETPLKAASSSAKPARVARHAFVLRNLA